MMFRNGLWHPEHHEQWLASLFGNFVWDKPKLVEGKPHKSTLPDLVQLHEDLLIAIPEFRSFTGDWKSKVKSVSNNFDHVLSFEQIDHNDAKEAKSTTQPSASAELGATSGPPAGTPDMSEPTAGDHTSVPAAGGPAGDDLGFFEDIAGIGHTCPECGKRFY